MSDLSPGPSPGLKPREGGRAIVGSTMFEPFQPQLRIPTTGAAARASGGLVGPLAVVAKRKRGLVLRIREGLALWELGIWAIVRLASMPGRSSSVDGYSRSLSLEATGVGSRLLVEFRRLLGANPQSRGR